jgi:hypothetical protein
VKFFLSGELDGTRPHDLIDKKFQLASTRITEKLTPILAGRNYGTEVLELNIIPIIVQLSPEMEKAGWYKERKLFKRKSHSTDFRLRISYDEFRDATDDSRLQLLIDNIIESVRLLSSRAKNDFAGKQLERDIVACFNNE